jgi:methionyl-tRNA synthetase
MMDSAFAASGGTPSLLITATPPTPNGDMHLGHLAGPYVAGDVFARSQRMQGARALYVTGIDDHQSYVPLRGWASGQDPETVASDYGERIESTWKQARIDFDHVDRPARAERHDRFVQSFFMRLYDRGHLVERQALSPYCQTRDMYLFEAYASGDCPHCGAGADGNVCEQCGRPNDVHDLESLRCKLCDQRPELRPFKRLFFPLSRFAERLQAYWSKVAMPPHLRALCQEMAADGLPDIAVTHPTHWGVPAPVVGYEDQKIYVWFEMAPGYVAAAADALGVTGLTSEDTVRGWNEAGTTKVQFFGFDNGYFHAVLFPALFMAYGDEIHLPDIFVVNEFYRLAGAKFSTSRQHAIWASEFLEQESADALRYYLCYDRPRSQQTNFTFDDYRAVRTNDLCRGWLGWLDELQARMSLEYDSRVPQPGDLSEVDGILGALRSSAHQVAADLDSESFAPDAALRRLNELVRMVRSYGAAWDHTRDVRACDGRRATARVLEVTAAKTLALLGYPLMPDFAATLWQQLGLEGSVTEHGWREPTLVAPGIELRLVARDFAVAVV